MKQIYWGAILLVTMFAAAVPVMSQTSTPTAQATPPAEFALRTDPISLIGAYYNAISLGDYQRAYSYWETAPDNATEQQFAAGFADTQGARAFVRLPVFPDASAGNVYASLPTLVIATKLDGSQQIFEGCFTAHKVNIPVGNATEPDPNWSLRDATLAAQDTLDFGVLDNACEQTTSLTEELYPATQLDPAQLLESYFFAVAQGDFSRAASYWERPSDDVLLSQFGEYFTNAPKVSLFLDPQIFTEGAAGSIYASISSLVIVTASDGSALDLAACFTARKSNVPVGDATEPDPNWFFYNAVINEAADAQSAIDVLTSNCSS